MPIQPELEIWKQSTLAPDYEVSNLGFIRRFAPGGNATYPGRILKRVLNKDGYWTTCLYVNGKVKRVRVHILVAEAFLGKRQDGYQVNHKDLDKTNAAVSNLEYVTQVENMRHAIESGVHYGAQFGEKNAKAKLTVKSVLEIKKLYRTNDYSCRDLAGMFGMSHSSIASILRGETWRETCPSN